jgi:CRP-like cAMP-binding protein
MADLQSCGLFAGLPEKEMKEIRPQFREVTHSAGTEIMVLGEGGVGFMVILDGEAEVRLQTGQSRLLGPGDFFGEIALLDQGGRAASVTAKSNLRVAAIPEWSFPSFVKEHPEVAWRLLQHLTQIIRQAEA